MSFKYVNIFMIFIFTFNTEILLSKTQLNLGLGYEGQLNLVQTLSKTLKLFVR